MTAYSPAATRNLWNLRELMDLFKVADVMGLMMSLNQRQCDCEKMRLQHGPGTEIDDASEQSLASALRAGVELCRSIGFDNASKTMFGVLTFVEQRSPLNVSQLESDMRHCYTALLGDCLEYQFLQIQKDRLDYLTAYKPFPGGEKVKTAFPSAHFDLCEAADCLAFERPTAAVFHLMRAVEWALRALCADLGLLHVVRDKNAATPTLIPIELAQWEQILNQMPKAIEARVNAESDLAAKKEVDAFYKSARLDIQAFKDAFRNHIMHTRVVYNRKEADAVFERVRDLMDRLSVRISE